MKPIPFARQSVPMDDPGATAERLVNLYAEQLPPDATGPLVIRSTPGLQVLTEAGDGPIYAIAQYGGTAYFVSGDKAYRLAGFGGTPELLGTMAGATALATIAIGPRYVVFCSPPNGYAATHGVPGLNQINHVDFKPASSVAFLDGRWVWSEFLSSRYFVSELDAPNTYDPLAAGGLESNPTVLVRVGVVNREVWMFGSDRTEIFYNAGLTPNPLLRQGSGVIERGIAAQRSLALCDGRLYWLADDGTVRRSNGYQAERVSTHALERKMFTYGGIADAIGAAYNLQGHSCYTLTFPSAHDALGHTWVLDTVTGLWHEKSSAGVADRRWIGESATQFGAIPIVGSAYSGKIYTMVDGLGREEDTPLYAEAVLPPLTADGARAFMGRLELDMEVGSPTGPVVVRLDYADDRGATFGSERLVNIRPYESRRQRVRFERLGSFRHRTLRLRTYGRCAFYGARTDAEAGAH